MCVGVVELALFLQASRTKIASSSHGSAEQGLHDPQYRAAPVVVQHRRRPDDRHTQVHAIGGSHSSKARAAIGSGHKVGLRDLVAEMMKACLKIAATVRAYR
jgi:hypothetical protein